jgi:hypothetical protein
LAHKDRRRWHLHFTPTSSSWLNLIERWFKELTDKRLRRGTFNSVADLSTAKPPGLPTGTKTRNRSSGKPPPRTSSSKPAEDGQPSTRPFTDGPLGTFLRAFTFGHVRQLGAVAAALLATLAAMVTLLRRIAGA